MILLKKKRVALYVVMLLVVMLLLTSWSVIALQQQDVRNLLFHIVNPPSSSLNPNAPEYCDGAISLLDARNFISALIRGQEPSCPTVPATCGNAVRDNTEECDDGNRNNNDGCSSQCTAEYGFVCRGHPSQCHRQESLGDQRVLTIIVGFQDDPQNYEIYKRESEERAAFVQQYFQEASYGKTRIINTVVGPYTLSREGCIPGGGGNYDTNDRLMLQRGIQAADPDVDLRQFNRLIFINKDYNLCPTGNSGSTILREGDSLFHLLNSNDGQVSASFTRIPYSSFSLQDGNILHEFGHSQSDYRSSFALSHLNANFCRDSAGNKVTWSANCENIFGLAAIDPMGNTFYSNHYNALYKERLGWLSEKNVITTNNGDYLIEPLETPSDGPKLIKIPIPLSTYQYFLDFRQPVGFDAGNEKPLDGVFLYLNDLSTSWSFLLDPPPFGDATQFEFSPMQVGVPYTHPEIGLTITVQQVTPQGARLSIRTIPVNGRIITQCNDGFNNDNSGEGVFPSRDDTDWSCFRNGAYDPNTLSEFEPFAECEDFYDNDRDGTTDVWDENCQRPQWGGLFYNSQDNSESS